MLKRLFCHVPVKRDVLASSFELLKGISKMYLKLGLVVPKLPGSRDYLLAWVATISRRLKLIGLFCNRAL